MRSEAKAADMVLIVLGVLAIGGGVVLCGLLLISGYFMLVRPAQPVGADAQPVPALLCGIFMGVSLIALGWVMVRKGRRNSAQTL
jgi:hypothetical protein